MSIEYYASEIKKLEAIIVQIESITCSPKLAISEYFSSLRTNIDCEFNKLEFYESRKDIYKKMIDYTNNCETNRMNIKYSIPNRDNLKWSCEKQLKAILNELRSTILGNSSLHFIVNKNNQYLIFLKDCCISTETLNNAILGIFDSLDSERVSISIVANEVNHMMQDQHKIIEISIRDVENISLSLSNIYVNLNQFSEYKVTRLSIVDANVRSHLANIPNLETLILDNANISNCAHLLKSYDNLTTLSLINNEITMFELCLPKLEHLLLQGNSIQSISLMSSTLKNINISGNSLRSFSISDLNEYPPLRANRYLKNDPIEKINLRGNSITNFQIGKRGAVEIDLRDNPSQNLNSFKFVRGLKVLSLDNICPYSKQSDREWFIKRSIILNISKCT